MYVKYAMRCRYRSIWMALISLLGLSGCGIDDSQEIQDADVSDEGSSVGESYDAQEMDARQREEGALTTSTLALTTGNLSVLKNGNYSGVYLLYANSSTKKGGQSLAGGTKYQETKNTSVKATQVATDGTCTSSSTYGCGWCVDFVKSVGTSSGSTSTWKKGSKVVSAGVTQGTAIAVFVCDSSGNCKYDNTGKSHVAFFDRYTYDTTNKVNGFYVWDQNWEDSTTAAANGDGVVRSHSFSSLTGSETNSLKDARSYYTVQLN